LNGQVDSKKADDKFGQVFKTYCESQTGSINLPDKSNTSVSFSGERGICNWDTLTQDQRKNIMTLYNTREDIVSQGGSDVLRTMINNQLGSATLDAKNYYEQVGAIKEQQAEMKKIT